MPRLLIASGIGMAFTVSICLAASAGSTTVEDARAHLDSKDYSGALRVAQRALKSDPHDDEAMLVAAQAEIGLEEYAAAVRRLSAASPATGRDGERESLLAMATYLDAERNPKLSVDAARERRRQAVAAADRALSAGGTSVSLHAARATSLRKLGDYPAAREAVLAWLAAAPGEVEARETLQAIDAAAARWAALDPPPVGTPAPDLAPREAALIAQFNPMTRESSGAVIDEFLGAETDRQRRAQLLILRIASVTSIGRAELAALEALEAGFVDARSFDPVIKSIRKLDPAVPFNDELHLDGATPPERYSSGPPTRITTKPTGGTVVTEVLYRVEPDGHVGIAVVLKSSAIAPGKERAENLRRERFHPAMRNGRPVAVPQYSEHIMNAVVGFSSGSNSGPP